jgi:hypothetical protein
LSNFAVPCHNWLDPHVLLDMDKPSPLTAESGLSAAHGFGAPRLLGITYRMLGSYADAQDVVRDTWLGWNSNRPADLRSAEAGW